MFEGLFNYIESLITKNLAYFTMINSGGDVLNCTIFKKSEFCDTMCIAYGLENNYIGDFRWDFDKEYLTDIMIQMTSDTPCYMTLVRYVTEFEGVHDIQQLDETHYHEIISFIVFKGGSYKRLNLDYVKSLSEEEIALYSDFSVFIGATDDEVLPVCYLR